MSLQLSVRQSIPVLRGNELPMRGVGTELPRIISLFCGAGGLDLGFHEEGYRVPLAIDISPAAIKSHSRNFKDTLAVVGDLTKLGPKGVLEYVRSVVPNGERIALIGGPPCQGFSRANVNSSANDPRNSLPSLYLDVVRLLQSEYVVEFVVFENVLGIRDKKHEVVYRAFLNSLNVLGFDVTEKMLCALDYGVPQNRKRIIISALRSGQGYSAVVPEKVLGPVTVAEVISGMCEPAFFRRGLESEDIPFHPNHWTMQPKSKKFSGEYTPSSASRSFRRLKWDAASPTIAFGNREIYVHPSGHRRISILEAMLLQGFPKGFVLEGNLSEQAQQISNAVPPPLAKSVASAVKVAMEKGRRD